MSTLFAFALIAHVLAGIIGVMGTFIALLALLRSKPRITKLRVATLVAACGYFISWFSGGYYYWFYYGDNVKPVIKDGDFPWAHLIVMETKEHVFLLLPLLSLVMLGAAYFSGKRLAEDLKYKNAVTYLSIVTFVLAVLIALSGILISGGGR